MQYGKDWTCPHGQQWGDCCEVPFLERLKAMLIDTHGLDSIPDPEPLIGEDIVFRDSLVWIVGKPGSYKSFVALDMAGCVATGEAWQGNRVHQGAALYLVAEGVRGTKKRVRAWEKAMGVPMDGVTFLPVAVQSKISEQWNALIEVARQIPDLALIVIDTQARVTVGVEENSNTEMGEFVDKAERLRRATGATVAIVHHIGRHGETGRGATTLDGAMGTIIKVTKEDDRATLECQKNKDGAEWEPIELRAVPVGESIVMYVDEGGRKGRSAVEACAKSLAKWRDTFADDWVSGSALIKAEVFAERTFFRYRLKLVEAGAIEKIGEGRSVRYRLIVNG